MSDRTAPHGSNTISADATGAYRVDPTLPDVPIVAVSIVAAAMLAVVVSFVGPLNTATTLGLGDRFLYWGVCAAVAWPFWYVMHVGMLYLTRFVRHVDNSVGLLTALTILHGAVLVTVVARVADTLFRPDHPSAKLVSIYALATLLVASHWFCRSLLLYIIRCIVSGSLRAHDVTTIAAGDGWREPSSFLERLPEDVGRNVIFIKADDHYLDVYTTEGQERLLMSLANAVMELGDSGIRVHRSFWVARRHVVELQNFDGRHRLVLTGGHYVPVSRTYLSDVRMAATRLKAIVPESRPSE